MCENTAFKQKVVELANKLQADVVNKADILVSFPCLAGLQTIQLSPTKADLPNNQIVLGLERQDVFLTEKIAVYSRLNTGELNMEATSVAGLSGYYRGVLSFSQRKTKVASNIHLHNFVKRLNFTGTGDNNDFDLEKIWQEVVPYWLLSGERDNTFEIVLEQPSVAIANRSIVLHLQGVLFPNASSMLK